MSVFEAVPSPAPDAPWRESLGEMPAPAWDGGHENAPMLESPFASASLTDRGPAPGPAVTSGSAESPFRGGFVPVGGAERESEAFHDVLAELEDEQFDEAVTRLVDEAAGQHLASGAAWSSSEAAPALATAELEAWIQPLQYEADRMLQNMADRLDGEDVSVLREPELEALFESLQPDPGFLPEAFENFLGGVFNVAKKLVKGAVSGIGKLASLPLRFLLGKLQALVRPLLQKVLKKAIGLLPASAQPIARTIAARLGPASEAETLADGHDLSREFQVQAAGVLTSGGEAEAEAIVAEAEAEAAEPGSAALHELDQARAQLAQQLTALPPGAEPVAELEQFIPVVMAAQQAIKLGIKLIGRDKVVGFLARAIASLIKGWVGDQAASAIGKPIADTGLKLLGLEAAPLGETGGGLAGATSLGAETVLGSEALASTIEETVRDVLQLPAEAFEDPLRLEAETQEAFAEAAARNIPRNHLKPDLPQLETAGEGGVWVLMPRAARPRYRYKKYSHVFYLPVTRQVARAIATRDGGTLESLLADHGVTAWPAQVEIHLYEAMPGTHLGHIAAFEAGPGAAAAETLDGLQPLTAEASAMLTREPRLGRPAVSDHRHPVSGHHAVGHHPGPEHGSHPAVHPGRMTRPLAAGNRYYRVRAADPGRTRSDHPRHRFRVGFETRGGTRGIHVQLHLSEREAQELGQLLHRGALPAVLTWLKHRYHHVAPAVFTARLLRHGAALLGQEPASHQAVQLALQLTEALTRELADFVRRHQAELVTAVQNPAQGLTLSFTFRVEDPAALLSGRVPTPQVGVRAGHHHGARPAAPGAVPPPGPDQARVRPAAPQPPGHHV